MIWVLDSWRVGLMLVLDPLMVDSVQKLGLE